MIGLRIGQVVQFVEDDHRERLLWLDPGGRGGWFVDIDDERAVPVCRGRGEVEELLAEDLIADTEDPWIGSGAVQSDVQEARRDEAWDAIRPIAMAQPECFDPRKRAALTQARVAETGITRQRLYRLLRRWWQRGMTQSALTPDYADSGGPGQRKTDRGVKRGAPVKYGPEGLNVDDRVRAAFRDAVTRYLARNNKLNVADCYDKCLQLHFCDFVIDETTGRQMPVLREAHPSIWQFRYWLEQDNDLFELARKRRTPRVYDKDSRGIPTYFPAALPDELLYSRLARCQLYSCSTSAKWTLDDLFGDRSVRAAIDLQCHLRALCARVSELTRCTPADLLRGTLLGYYVAYQPITVRQAAQKAMLDGPAEGLHARLGIAAGMRLPPNPLRWCKRCYAESVNLHGEAYWRRTHQLPGVLVCPSHALALQGAHLPKRVGQHDFIAATSRTCPSDLHPAPEWSGNPVLMQLLWRVAHQRARLLDHPAIFSDLAALTDHCRRHLIAADLALPSGRLRLKHLSVAARTRLAPFKGLFPEADSIDWLVAMGRKHRQTFSPLQHLLFDLVISDTARGANPKRNRVLEPRRFLADDPGFEARLRRAAIEANSIRDAAHMVGVDPKMIQQHAARLQLAGPWVLRAPSVQATAPDPSPAIKRRWRADLAAGGNRAELRHKLPAE